MASESTFSTSGRTLSPVRNSLNDESMEALICAQDWLCASITGIFYLYYYCSYYCTELNVVINYCVYLRIFVDKLVIHCGVIKQQQMIPYVVVEHDMLFFCFSVSVLSFAFVASWLLSYSANLLLVCQ
jgi:hAT family C-terminal dimerisation region